MTEREQMQNVCQWNRELARESRRLREALGRSEHAGDELRCANANLQAQLEAADVMLGVAMDEALGVR
jgi:hypothetical protein